MPDPARPAERAARPAERPVRPADRPARPRSRPALPAELAAEPGQASRPAAADAAARPAPWIVTLFATYARPNGNWLPIATVVSLMADLGVDGTAVRSSISRLKRRGVLVGSRRSGVAGYALAESTVDLLAEGDVRIFRHERATVADGWVVVTFSVPEAERDRRHDLRTALTRLGFGTVTAGVWVAPGHLAGTVRDALDRRGLSAYADLFTGPHVAYGDLRDKVRRWWNLPELAALYDDFLHRYADAPPSPAPLDAFRTYVPMLTRWRRLPYRDPGIPLALLPADWPGVAAGTLFDTLHRTLEPLADTHTHRTLPPAGREGTIPAWQSST